MCFHFNEPVKIINSGNLYRGIKRQRIKAHCVIHRLVLSSSKIRGFEGGSWGLRSKGWYPCAMLTHRHRRRYLHPPLPRKLAGPAVFPALIRSQTPDLLLGLSFVLLTVQPLLPISAFSLSSVYSSVFVVQFFSVCVGVFCTDTSIHESAFIHTNNLRSRGNQGI